MCTSRQQNPANHLKDTCTHVPTAKLLSSSPLFSRAETRYFLINPKSAARLFSRTRSAAASLFGDYQPTFPNREAMVGRDLERRMTSQTLHHCTTDSRIQVTKMLAPFSGGFTCPFSPQRSLVKWRGCARGLLHASLIDSLVNRKLLRSCFSFRAC
jgi:hypothetical protein